MNVTQQNSLLKTTLIEQVAHLMGVSADSIKPDLSAAKKTSNIKSSG